MTPHATTSAAGDTTGVWLIGARGSVATTAVAGCAALAAQLLAPTGMVTETDAFTGSGLPALDSLVFGGHDTASTPLPKRAEELAAQGIADFATDLRDFARRTGVARTVVVNVASTEPEPAPGTWPASSLYAAAALRAGCAFADFTPSTGLRHPQLAGAARVSGLPYAGRDGKTGQTLLRAVLGPMFAQRALAVRAWSGTNLLGGGDGAALADPAAARAKNAGKERVLADTLGTTPQGEVHIDDVPALGEWKTAWDHVAFDGFLGTRMVLQTIWQGCDSALAAPLVLDLARLLARAHEKGLSGPRPELGFYFKDPDGDESALTEQYAHLLAFAARLGHSR